MSGRPRKRAASAHGGSVCGTEGANPKAPKIPKLAPCVVCHRKALEVASGRATPCRSSHAPFAGAAH
eukprot:1364077-Pyramimonas_sp.AAC.1